MRNQFGLRALNNTGCEVGDDSTRRHSPRFILLLSLIVLLTLIVGNLCDSSPTDYYLGKPVVGYHPPGTAEDRHKRQTERLVSLEGGR